MPRKRKKATETQIRLPHSLGMNKAFSSCLRGVTGGLLRPHHLVFHCRTVSQQSLTLLRLDTSRIFAPDVSHTACRIPYVFLARFLPGLVIPQNLYVAFFASSLVAFLVLVPYTPQRSIPSPQWVLSHELRRSQSHETVYDLGLSSCPARRVLRDALERWFLALDTSQYAIFTIKPRVSSIASTHVPRLPMPQNPYWLSWRVS